ncbi:MAG: DUF1501 domain-containing protein [Planctomycetes bacterium]|nr:DUF1501 domain-containing protein [Planctomycetota bacterium]
MTYTRRNFLKATLGSSALLSLGTAAPNFLVRSMMAATHRRNERNTVLVVVQLSGGNDGLNTVVPYEDDEYARNRPTLRLSPNEIHKINSRLGFHPRMGAFMRLYDQGHLSIIQGVGYPNTDRSHESGMRVWHTAAPDEPDCQTGWLGRTVDSIREPNSINAPAVFVGPIAQPFGLNAKNAVVPSIRSLENLTMREIASHNKNKSRRKRTARLPRPGQNNPLMHFLQQCTQNAYTNSEQIEAVMKKTANTAEYPQFELAGSLRMVAQLIRADIGIRIFFTELGGGGIGGFDNHANQLGNHCSLLGHFSESIAAFIHDLKRDKLLNRVLLMTFSEFGRTVKENGRRGTGHGAAAPIFLAGGRLKGGLVGPHPSLSDLDNGALKFHTDFRSVYATVLDRWLGFDSSKVLDKQFEPLNILNV